MKRTLLSILAGLILQGCGESSEPNKKHLEQRTRSDLTFSTIDNRNYSLSYEKKANGILITEGTTRSPLHFTEANEVNHFENIKEGDSFVLTDQRKRTRILMYDGIISSLRKMYFIEWSDGTIIEIPFNPQMREATLDLNGSKYRVVLTGLPYRIGIDQNHDGQFTGERPIIYENTGTRIREEDIE